MSVAVQVESLSTRDVRRVYLITCSQANRDIVPTRKAFVCIVLDAFENAVPKSNCTVIHWRKSSVQMVSLFNGSPHFSGTFFKMSVAYTMQY